MANRLFIIVCGLPGAGKSAVAKLLAKRLHAKLLRTDSIRKKLFSSPAYTKKEAGKVYQTLFSYAQKTSPTRNIILDATFSKKRHRMTARRIAKRRGYNFLIIEAVCKQAVVRRRLGKRTHRNKSDARFPQYLTMQSHFERITEHHLIIDTSRGRKFFNPSLNSLF